jgi:O-antigen/teichoic acid export membrane protein
VLLAELVLAAIGLCFARDYLARPQLDTGYLAPYLQFGLVFYGSSLLYNASERSSEALVRLASGSYVEVGYFSLAYAIYQMAVLTISQLTLAFAPLLAMLRTQGHEATLRTWAERLLKGLAIATVLLIYGTLFLAEALVPPVFGAAYLAVAGNLIPLTVALIFLGLSQVANLLALVYELPRNMLSASALRLVALWTLGLPLAAWRGSFGACLAIVAASAVHAAYITRRMQRVSGYSLRQWLQVVCLGLLFLPLLWLRSSSGADGLLYGLFTVGYLALLWLLRLVAPEELATLRSLMRKN